MIELISIFFRIMFTEHATLYHYAIGAPLRKVQMPYTSRISSFPSLPLWPSTNAVLLIHKEFPPQEEVIALCPNHPVDSLLPSRIILLPSHLE
ncbi:hypothetical protein AVEN_114399-1 [Araneus ventricosus]|uniref:Uncharacterized protein n=1 Tax=Araneus ventricosus TaxID=182803 RepID=A0A4Y2SP23_ARAVE|nr:hypothetical protein AVEN_114399-1 [Araneus ventricosus]